MPIFGFDAGKNLIETYTTTEILTILQEAIDNQSLAGLDPSIAPVISVIRESNNNADLSFWYGTEAEYNNLGVTAKIVFARVGTDGKVYLCSDDSTWQTWLAAAKADIVATVSADITNAQNTADEALLTANTAAADIADTNDYYTRSSFITEVKLVTNGGGTVEPATDYTLNASASFQKIAAKSPKIGYCDWNIQFYFNDARTIAAGDRLRFYYRNAANDMAKVYGQGIVMANTNLGTFEYVGVWSITSYLNCIEVYLEKPTVSVLITQVTTGTYSHS